MRAQDLEFSTQIYRRRKSARQWHSLISKYDDPIEMMKRGGQVA